MMKLQMLERKRFWRKRIIISEFNRFVLFIVQPAAPGLNIVKGYHIEHGLKIIFDRILCSMIGFPGLSFWVFSYSLFGIG